MLINGCVWEGETRLGLYLGVGGMASPVPTPLHPRPEIAVAAF